MRKHEQRLFEQAWGEALASPDPSTKVGAVIAQGSTVMARGYNQIPRAIHTNAQLLSDREWKYPRIIHAEMDALLKYPHVLGLDIYVTHYPCSQCAKHLIHAGIRRVFTTKPSPEMLERWPDMEISARLFAEAGVTVVFPDR